MEELIVVVEKLGERDIVDYLIAFMPIVLSVIAIVISIHTTKKQNDIALFEKRYKVLAHVRSIIKFDESIHDCNDPKLILSLFDAYYGTNLSKISIYDGILLSTSFFSNMKNEVLMGKFLFGVDYDEEITLIIENLRKVVGKALSNKIDEDIQANLHAECLFFAKETLQKMNSKMKL